jgi:hypothetical protein
MTPHRSVDPDFDPRISDWLESDPDEAPRALLETVLAATPSIQQRRAPRMPWRFQMILSTARLSAAAVLAVAVVTAALLVSRAGSTGPSGIGATPSLAASLSDSPTPAPSASPSPTPTPAPSATPFPVPALTSRFTSKLYAYSIGRASAWTGTQATTTWRTTAPDPTATFMDKITGPGVRLVIASQSLGGKTPDEWKQAYVGQFGQDGVGVCDVLPPDWPTIQIGAQPGFLDGNDCPGDEAVAPGDRFFEAVTFVEGRVYLFWIQGVQVDRAYFQRVLDSVVFTELQASPTPTR